MPTTPAFVALPLFAVEDMLWDADGWCHCRFSGCAHLDHRGTPLSLADYGVRWHVLDLFPDVDETEQGARMIVCEACAAEWIRAGVEPPLAREEGWLS